MLDNRIRVNLTDEQYKEFTAYRDKHGLSEAAAGRQLVLGALRQQQAAERITELKAV